MSAAEQINNLDGSDDGITFGGSIRPNNNAMALTVHTYADGTKAT